MTTLPMRPWDGIHLSQSVFGRQHTFWHYSNFASMKKNTTTSYPETKERFVYWLGLDHHVVDALCSNILTCDTHKVIQWSVVQLVDKDHSLNVEATFPIDE
jgi:hypothetical protein